MVVITKTKHCLEKVDSCESWTLRREPSVEVRRRQHVLFISGLNYKLFSIGRVGQLGIEVTFSKKSAVMKRDEEVVYTGSHSD